MPTSKVLTITLTQPTLGTYQEEDTSYFKIYRKRTTIDTLYSLIDTVNIDRKTIDDFNSIDYYTGTNCTLSSETTATKEGNALKATFSSKTTLSATRNNTGQQVDLTWQTATAVSVGFWLRFSNITDLNTVTLKIGSDSSNYRSATFTNGVDFTATVDVYHFLFKTLNSFSTTGSPSLGAVDYVDITVTYNNAQSGYVLFDFLRADYSTITYTDWTLGNYNSGIQQGYQYNYKVVPVGLNGENGTAGTATNVSVVFDHYKNCWILAKQNPTSTQRAYVFITQEDGEEIDINFSQELLIGIGDNAPTSIKSSTVNYKSMTINARLIKQDPYDYKDQLIALDNLAFLPNIICKLPTGEVFDCTIGKYNIKQNNIAEILISIPVSEVVVQQVTDTIT